ncbi:hypothetical protein [Leptotrichia sp. oral taxon 223]|uniref:hypothetical protein n=1 Tax=Leptotrichia sp. oral taxon 223 TaxID=712363 RepID=UPI0015C01862|nr:hypothetical protein [Leptotrichia sp. oral taxon 223]NWO18243.1 hypothetical protein [Leptotrichia sp. oral taxon 223]
MLFVIFALVVVIATGIPFVKKGIENRNLMKEYVEQGLGKHEAIGKIKDAKTTNDKVIEGLFYLSFVALLGGGFYNFYLYENENSDNMGAQQQSEKTMAQITTDQSQNPQSPQNQQNQQNQGIPAIQNNIITDSNDAQIQENVRKEQARIDKMFADSQKNTESLFESLKKSLDKKDTASGIKNGEKALENVKKSNNLFKNAKCNPTGDATFDKECPKLLEKGKELYSSKQIDVEKMLGVLKEIEKGINNVKNSEIGQQAMEEGGKLWDSLMKKVDEVQKK